MDDHYVDAMNYLAFAAQFAPIHEPPKVTEAVYRVPASITVPGFVTMKDEPKGMVEEDIAEIAKRFAHAKPEEKSE